MSRTVRAVASLATLMLVVATPPAVAEIGPTNPSPETVTAQPLPTWQTNGTVWAMKVVGNVVYVGGNFTAVRPPGAAPGTNETKRLRLAAFDVATGNLLPWAPEATANPYDVPAGQTLDKDCTKIDADTVECATVWSLATTPDGANLIVGGDFTQIDGKARGGMAAFSTASGALSTTFKPFFGGRVYSVAATNDAVWAGGGFTKVNTVDRQGLAALDFPAGTLRDFAPTVTRSTSSLTVKGVRAIALTEDGSRLIVGGGFDKINGSGNPRLGAVDAATGVSAPWNSNRISTAAFLTSVNVYGDTAYTTGDALGSVSEGIIAFDAMTGQDKWYDSCRGASHSMAITRGVVYVGSHAHDCGVAEDGFGEQYQGYQAGDRRRYTLRAEVPGSPGKAQMLHWFPKTNDGNGARAMAATNDHLWIGGEFTQVDTYAQQGLLRFSFLDAGGVNRKPLKPTTPTVTSTRPGEVDVAWPQAEDPDNADLTYRVFRDGDFSNPIHTVSSSGRPWLQKWMRFIDKDVQAGSTHTYAVRATDPLGAVSSASDQASVTVADAAPDVTSLAKRAGAAMQFSFETLQGGRHIEGVSGRLANTGSGISTTQGTGASGSGINASGSTGGVVSDTALSYSRRAASMEALFNSTTTRGGVITSLGNSSSTTGLSSSNTLSLYMDNAGRLNFGIRPDVTRTDVWASPASSQQALTTTGSYNDGKWHHVVGTFEPGTGLQIWVDGQKVAENPALNWSRSVNAYLRVGSDRNSAWPNTPSSAWFAGSIDEAAAYRYPLSGAQIEQHAALMLGRLTPPTGLKATVRSSEAIDLTWNAVKGAQGYKVFRDGVQVADVTDTTHSDTGLTPRTSYSYHVLAYKADGDGPGSAQVSATTDPAPPLRLLQTGSTWRFATGGSEPAGWSTPEYDDSAWQQGPSKLGQAEADLATELTPFGSDGVTRRITTYFRNDFTLPSAAEVRELALQVKRDDGVIVYVNGQEVFRDNMPAGVITDQTLATTWAPDDGTKWLSAVIPTSVLQDGRNVVAVEIHQNARSSLDLSFDLQLDANR